jgi:hypothetical protein
MYTYRGVALLLSCINCNVVDVLTCGFRVPYPRATNANKILEDAEKDFGPALGPSSSNLSKSKIF